MAENVAITAGAGTTIGTDEVTINAVAVQVQRVKLVDSTEGGAGAQFPAPGALGDAAANPTTILVGAALLRYAPSGGVALWDRPRLANVFKTVDLVAATAETTIWTPATGRKFRLMGFMLTCSSNSKLSLRDGTAGTIIVVCGTGANSPTILGAEMLGGLGILSAVADNVLTVTRLTSGTLTGLVWGCEE